MQKRKGMTIGRLEGFLRFSLLLHLLWLVLFVFLVWVGPANMLLPAPEWLMDCETCIQTSDAIKSAAELGRLDIVSISLTVLGVSLAFAAIISYGYVKGAAHDAAVNETSEWLEANYEKLTPAMIEFLLSNERFILTLATEAKKRISADEKSMSPSQADDIARSMEEQK